MQRKLKLKYMYKRLVLTFILIITGCIQVIVANEFPTHYRVTTTLNVRSGPGTEYYKIGQLYQDNHVTIKSFTYNHSMQWGETDYYGQTGYVAMQYLEPLKPDTRKDESAIQTNGNRESSWASVEDFFSGLWTVIKWIGIILLVLIVLASLEYIIQLVIYAAMFAGMGALLFYIFGGSGETGASVGLVVAALIGLKILIGALNLNGGFISALLFLGYRFISLPIYGLNRLEHFLIAPWRYFFKSNWVSDSSKPTLRVILETITIIMYIVTTPLRLANAIIYNIIIHCVTGIYDLLFEVLVPSDAKEGSDDVWRWIYMLPYRVIYYVIWHGSLLLVESAIWTVVDIFIPALTFYHGTTLYAGNSIICDPQRNQHLQNTSNWLSGNFMASSTPNRTWAGRGIYFAIQRSLAMGYSSDNRSGLGGSAVMIVCRVSIGRVISYALMPTRVYNQTGDGGWHDEINKFADANGYTTGEWWNPRGVWEYCLFDWQNGYNNPWRIRPVYMFNLEKGIAQHIPGGMQHWLFDKNVLNNILG